jgi:hypothetical protein
LAEKALVLESVVNGVSSKLSWLCWALVHAAVTQAAAGVWAPAGARGTSNPISDPAASANVAPTRQARASSFH